MPTALADEASRNPFEAVAWRARQHLAVAIPALASDLERFPLSVFGLTSGFFYLTAAQGRAWGMRGSVITDILTVQALGHFHFAFHDSVIDEGNAPAVMCLPTMDERVDRPETTVREIGRASCRERVLCVV